MNDLNLKKKITLNKFIEIFTSQYIQYVKLDMFLSETKYWVIVSPNIIIMSN